MNVNKTIIAGNLTRDPDGQYTRNGRAVCNFGVAVNHRWKDAQGEYQEEATFFDVEAWGKTAEFITEYFAKGKPIYIEGRMKQDNWTDKDTGAKRSKLVLVVQECQFVGNKNDQANQQPQGGYQQPAQGYAQPQQPTPQQYAQSQQQAQAQPGYQQPPAAQQAYQAQPAPNQAQPQGQSMSPQMQTATNQVNQVFGGDPTADETADDLPF